MGSAFYAESRVFSWAADPQMVMFCLADPDIVCHVSRLDCRRQDPHRLIDCGAFATPRQELLKETPMIQTVDSLI